MSNGSFQRNSTTCQFKSTWNVQSQTSAAPKSLRDMIFRRRREIRAPFLWWMQRKPFKRKILNANPKDIIVWLVEPHVLSHPTNAEIETRACAAVKHVVKARLRSSAQWKDEIDDSIQPAVGCLQIYSDKTQKSLSASSNSFYPLYVTLLNFIKHMRRRLIVLGSTEVEYLPRSYSDSGSATKQKDKRIANVAILQQFIIYVMTPLVECALNGLQCIKKGEWTFSLQLMTPSYVADIPEAENLLSVKRGNCTTMPCHICEIKRENLAGFSDAPKRCWRKIEADLPRNAHMNGAAKDQLELLDKMPVLSVDPVLATFLFVGFTKVLTNKPFLDSSFCSTYLLW